MSNNIIPDLDNILALYQYNKDCYKIIKNIQETEGDRFFRDTELLYPDKDKIKAMLENIQKQSDDYYILYLWLTFERFIVDFLLTKGEKLIDIKPEFFADNFYCKFKEKVERWPFKEILDLFDQVIDKNLIASVKQIKDYRDWIAHRNINKSKPINTDPVRVYDTLTTMVKQILREAI
jgi:hypothetical protein